MIKYPLAVLTIILSVAAFIYSVDKWHVSYTLDRFKLPVFHDLNVEELTESDKGVLIEVIVLMRNSIIESDELESQSLANLSKSILIFGGSLIVQSFLLVWFMLSNIKLRRHVKNDDQENT